MKTLVRLGAGLLRGVWALAVGLFALLGAFLALAGRANRDADHDDEILGCKFGHTTNGLEPVVGEDRGANSGEIVHSRFRG